MIIGIIQIWQEVHKLSGLLKKEGSMNDVLFDFIKLSEIRQLFSFFDAIRSVH